MSRSEVLKLFGALVLGAVLANVNVLWGSFTLPTASITVTDSAAATDDNVEQATGDAD